MPTHFNGSESQRKALDLYIKLLRAADSVAGRATRSLLDSGITLPQFGVLEALLHLGPLKPSDIADKHLKSRNNITVVVDNLERQGLVARHSCPKDRRAVWITLTDEGRKLIESLFPAHAERVEEEMSILTCEERLELERLLRIIGLQERASE